MRYACMFACLIVAALTQAVAADNWPQWRGPTDNFVAPPGKYPVKLDPKKNAEWRVELPGNGTSTPCVWEDNIFVTCDIDGQDGIICLDLDGKEKWRKTLGQQKKKKRNHPNASHSNPTPITDGQRVFVYYRSGRVAALDFEGNVLWKEDLQEKYGKDTLWWILGTSPVFAGDNIVIAVIHEGDSYLVALDQKTGDVAWHTPRNYDRPIESDQAYTTPTVTEIDGVKTIVTWGADYLTGHDLDGNLIWSCGGFNPEEKKMWRVIASHAISGAHAIVPYGRGDNVAFVKLGGKGDITENAHVGSDGGKGIGSDVPTPVAIDGKAYLLTDRGKFIAYDITNGKRLWKEPFQLPRSSESYYCSPIKAGNRFYLSREDGKIFVVEETDHGVELIAENQLPEDEKQIAVPVLINDRILLRSTKALYYFK